MYLSLYGFVMAFATVFWIPTRIEPIFWVIIFIICAYLIARKCQEYFFWNGFMVSIINSIWITGVHIIFYSTYMANHPEMANMNSQMPLQEHPRLMMLMTGPVFGALSGIVLGAFAWIASKIVKKKSP